MHKFTPLNFKRRNKPVEKRMQARLMGGNTNDLMLLYATLLDTINRDDIFSDSMGKTVATKDYSSFLVSYDTLTYTPKKIYPLLNHNLEYEIYNVNQSPDGNLWVSCQAKQKNTTTR